MARTPEQVAAYKREWQRVNSSRISKERKAKYLYRIGELNKRHEMFERKLANLNPYEVGQIAAFVAGEGWITLTRQSIRNKTGRLYYTAAVGIGNTDARLMIWLQERLGGSVSWQPGCPSPTKPDGKVKYMGKWVVQGPCAASLCKLLIPHLVMKRERAILIVEMFRDIGVPGRNLTDAECHRRTAIYERFVRLRRGRFI